MITVYGIKQCDTCRKALKWLEAEGIEHQFQDFRVDGLDKRMLKGWLDSSFSEQLINKRSTTWRQLNDSQRDMQGDDQLKLLLDHPTLIKRPVFVGDEILAVGFKPKEIIDVLS